MAFLPRSNRNLLVMKISRLISYREIVAGLLGSVQDT